ncbi:LysR substrate-binding domain-containing protein [Microbulbifer litoralis]|uniref:LysR substrate-binding domain-containing protein n=1 Tax=Microbulbifer litoralis TaxID=2933965 RepID=UPI0020289627
MYERLGSLNGIRVFEAAARLGSFKAAAGELHITPTAVSHQIRNLEQRLDTALFERHTRAVSLTGAGALLADAARRSLQTLADAVEEIAGRPETLTINTTSAFATLWLVPRLPAFYRACPDLRVVVQSDERPVDLERQRQVDIAIRYGAPPPQEAGAEPLLRETFGLYGSAACVARAARGEPVPLFETRWQNRELPPVTAEQWLARFEPGEQRAERYRYDQELQVIQAALAGQGLAFASELLVESALQNGWLQPYREACRLPGFGYYLLTGGRGGRPKIARFRAWLRELLGQLPAAGGKPPD